MALDKPGLKQDIIDILTLLSARVDNPEQALEDFAEMLSTAIDLYVRSGHVQVNVTTTGTATAQTGTGTGTVS